MKFTQMTGHREINKMFTHGISSLKLPSVTLKHMAVPKIEVTVRRSTFFNRSKSLNHLYFDQEMSYNYWLKHKMERRLLLLREIPWYLLDMY